MRSYYPRSFITLLLVGFALIALPLIAALVTSSIAVDRLANRSQTAVYQSAQATQSSRRLIEVMTAMERSARQLVILGDRSVLDAYMISRQQFQQVAAEFAHLPVDATQRSELDSIVAEEKEIFEFLSDPATKPEVLNEQVVRFVMLSDRAREIMARSNQLIDREVEAMRSTANKAQRIVVWQAFMLIPVIVFLMTGFAVLILRPIKQLDAAIRELGNGKFTVPVEVNGPQDLEYLGERLDWMRMQLLGLEQQKNRFLQQVSHELKTPLTALREGAQLLSDGVLGSLSEEQREITTIMRHNSLELQKRIEDLLDYGEIHFHKLKLTLTQIDPNAIWDEVVQRQKLALQAKNINLRIQRVDLKLGADQEKIRVVFDNLLSNAIKYSPQAGTVTINMSSKNSEFLINVVDQGPGIAPSDVTRIFEPFYYGRVRGSGPLKASGLGLSIVKEYVLAHGGSVEVVATDQPGAHFRVQVPMKQVNQA